MKTIAITDPAEIEAIIRKCPYCTVGITDSEGNPYVIPMNFAYRDGIIYLHSGPEGGKVTMAEHHPRVCITFCEGHELVYMHRQVACSYSMKSRSVMCHGNVRFIEDMDEKRRILDIIMQQYVDYEFKYSEPAVRNVKIWEIKVDKMTCRSFGLRPSEVEVYAPLVRTRTPARIYIIIFLLIENLTIAIACIDASGISIGS